MIYNTQSEDMEPGLYLYTRTDDVGHHFFINVIRLNNKPAVVYEDKDERYGEWQEIATLDEECRFIGPLPEDLGGLKRPE